MNRLLGRGSVVMVMRCSRRHEWHPNCGQCPSIGKLFRVVDVRPSTMEPEWVYAVPLTSTTPHRGEVALDIADVVRIQEDK